MNIVHPRLLALASRRRVSSSSAHIGEQQRIHTKNPKSEFSNKQQIVNLLGISLPITCPLLGCYLCRFGRAAEINEFELYQIKY